MKQALFFIFLASALLLKADDVQKLKPVGYLRAGFWYNTSLSLNKDTVITSHLRNVSDAPLKLDIGPFNYNTMFLIMGIPEKGVSIKEDFDVWGATSVKQLKLKAPFVSYSGQATSRLEIMQWQKRDGLILFRDEGYARKIYFKQKWLNPKEVPAKTTCLTIDDSPSLSVNQPLLVANAVQPGKKILFDKSQKVYAPGGRLLPFSPRSNGRLKVKKIISKDKESGLCLDLEIKGIHDSKKDLELTYLIGNCGKKVIWVDQSSLLPAHLNLDFQQLKKSLKKIDGESLKALLNLYPSRQPVALNPGEFLTYRRVISPYSFTFRKHQLYDILGSVNATWYTSSKILTDLQKHSTLKCKISFKTK